MSRVAAVAYILLPVSGLAAFLLGSEQRMRFHGLQAIVLGLVWAIVLYAASALSTTATRVTFVVGAGVWVLFMVLAALGSNPRLPLAASALERAAATDPRAG